MAIKRWVKWVLVGCAAGSLVLIVAVVALGWFAIEHSRPGVEIGAAMPALKLSGFPDGGELRLDQFRGKVVVLDFWSSG